MAIEDHPCVINNGGGSSAGSVSDTNVSLNKLFVCQPAFARCVSRVYTPRDAGGTWVNMYARCQDDVAWSCKARRRALEGLNMLDAAVVCGVDDVVPLSW